MTRFFENSLEELERRNPGVNGNFKRIDAHQFTTTIYKSGKKVSWCRIFIGERMLGGGIAFCSNEMAGPGALNETLRIEADTDHMYLNPLGMPSRGTSGKLTFEGAAEY